MSTIEYSCGHQVTAHSGQAMPMQCACGVGEIVGARGQFYMSDEMSKKFRKLAMNASPLQAIKEEWSGVGLPPVGCICEGLWLEPPDGGGRDFESVHIKAYFGSQVWFESQSLDEVVCEIRDCEFRPIRTQAQRERDDAIEKALAMDCHPREGMLSRHDFCGALYDAGMLRGAGE